jgi:DNA-binding MarR family transcriptional regulator
MKPSLASEFASADASPGFLLWKVANLHQKLQRRALDKLGLTPTQFSVLACYGDLTRTGQVTQADVCAHAALDKMIVSDATRSLVANGLLAKMPSTTDRRASNLSLTRQGRSTCNRAIRIIETLDASFFIDSGNVELFTKQLQDILASSGDSVA